MSKELVALLDLQTAWQRLKYDLKKRVFIRHPYAERLIEHDLPGWLEICRADLADGRYAPKSMFVCDVPKGRGLIRPGSQLAHVDRLVYAALVGACLPAIHRRLAWSQGAVDFSYRLAVDPRNVMWIRDSFTGWKEFRERSLHRINQGFAWVTLTDISAFYENIDIGLLMSDLRETGAPRTVVDQIGVCLNRWAQVPGRGIPQGQSPSDILAKLYLNNVDMVLRDMGYVHMRYVDDIRVFCRTEVECKAMLIELSKQLRRRGLSLQSAKTRICPAEVAWDEIEEVTAILRTVRRRFIEEVVRETGLGDPYTDVHEAEEILDENPEEAPVEILTQAYQEHVASQPSENLNGTLFRFLLNRLGKQRDSFALDHSLSLLVPHPEETEAILHYLGAVGPGGDVEKQIVDLIRSGQLVYPYQLYQIVEWFFERGNAPSESLSEVVRVLAFEPSPPRYLRIISRAFLGKFGSAADLERLAIDYDTADPSERVEIICSIWRMERGKRNALLGRFEKDGVMNRRASQWVKSLGAEPAAAPKLGTPRGSRKGKKRNPRTTRARAT